jgi:hypothetical protein
MARSTTMIIGAAFLNVLVSAALVVLLVMSLWPVSRREVARFCDRYGVGATPATLPVLVSVVGRTRGARLLGATFVTVVGVRLIVAASQPAATADLLAIDDALRAHALHVVAGTGNTVGFVAASAALLQAGQASGHGIARSVLMALGFAALTLGAGASFGFRKASWRVRSKMPT